MRIRHVDPIMMKEEWLYIICKSRRLQFAGIKVVCVISIPYDFVVLLLLS